MRQWLVWCGVWGLLLACTACFEVREEVTLAKDGSGTYAFVLDLSETYPLLQQIYPDSLLPQAERDFQSQIRTALRSNLPKMDSLPGISDFRAVGDSLSPQYGFQFHFADAAALNSALQRFAQQDSLPPTFFEAEKKAWHKSDSIFFLPLLQQWERQGQGDEVLRNQRDFFLNTATYAYILRADRKIKRSNNTKAESKSKNELRFQVPLKKLLVPKTQKNVQVQLR